MAKQSKWDKYKKRGVQDNPKYREVHENQQIDRSPLGEKLGIGMYLAGASFIAFFAGVLSWLIVTVYQALKAASGAEGWFSGFVHFGDYWTAWPGFGGSFFIFTVCGLTFLGFYQWFMLIRDAQNADKETSDINQYENDQHIQFPEEVMRNYDFFPDAGYHSSVSVSGLISHAAIMNKGLKWVYQAKRAKADILDEDGNILYYKGEELVDEDGEVLLERVPVFDEKFMDDLYETSGVPDYPFLRRRFDATGTPYNPGDKNREKLKGYGRLSDLINGDWELPEYEPQRAGGVYIVDTAPINTMIF